MKKEMINYYKSAFDLADHPILIINDNTLEIIDCNKKAADLFGLEKEELYNLKMDEVSDYENGYTKDFFISHLPQLNDNAETANFIWKIKASTKKSLKVNLHLKRVSCETKTFFIIVINKNVERKRIDEDLLFNTKKQVINSVKKIFDQREGSELQKSHLFKSETNLQVNLIEERRQMALEAATDGIWDVNLETNQVYYSPGYFSMLGFDPYDFANKENVLVDLLHPEDYERVMKLLKNFLNSTKEFIDFEMRLKKKNGAYAWIHSRGKVFKQDILGKPLRIVGNHNDITQRKNFENIRNTLFEIANAVNITRNLDELFLSIQDILGGVVDTKNCYVALYDELHDTISLPFHKDEKNSFSVFPAGKTLFNYVIKTGITQLVNKKRAEELEEQSIIEPIGTPSESWLGIPLKIGQKIIGVFAIQSYDKDTIYTKDDVQVLEFVSDQIALAIERKKDQEYLITTQARHASIIESSPDGLIVIEPDGIIREHNTSILEMLNIKAKTITNRNFFDFITPGNVNKVKNVLLQTLESGFRKNFETRIIRDDGTNFFAEVSFGLISDKSKQSASFVIIIKNISERKNYEVNLKIAKNKAEESDRLKTSFLSNMSHEIRTPMNAIIGFAELLSSRDASDEERKEFIEQINQGAETLMRLIDDIIDISKIEAGQLIIHNSMFNLSNLMNDLYRIFQKSLYNLDKSHIRFIEDNNNQDINISVYTDQLRLKQIFSNLLDNALKFTESGEIRYGVKHLNKERITFYVKDTGIGIEKKKLKLIFERFRQGHETAVNFYSGTGLGLAISKNLTELMGGKISVHSVQGKGTEFIFTIPYKMNLNKKDSQDKE